MKNKTSTPAMQQYLDIKKKHPDTFLFYRMGDFYEMFYEDAKAASAILEIALTTRDKNRDNPIPMCGFPYHALEGYLARLVKDGHKVAVCEQMESPKEAKGVLRREVVRIVTPGTAISPMIVEDKESNYICSLFPNKNIFGFAVLDLSTGEFSVCEFNNTSDLKNEFLRTEPREVIVPNNNGIAENFPSLMGQEINPYVTPYEHWTFEYEYAHQTLITQLKIASLDGFGCGDMRQAVSAGGAIISFLLETQKSSLDHIRKIRVINPTDHMNLDFTTIRNLDLVRRWDGAKEDSLLKVLDMTSTPMGGRMLRGWLLKPLVDVARIVERQESVAELKESDSGRKSIKELISGIRDIERLTGRLTLFAAGPRDLITLSSSLKPLPETGACIKSLCSPGFKKLAGEWDDLHDVQSMIEETISPEPPFTVNEIGIICDGVDPDLDDLRKILREGKTWMSNLEISEREKLGISTLKIKFNNVFGFFIEVSKRESKRMPVHYVRKQTLVNVERYISPELKEYEDKVLSAEEKIKEIESRIFGEVRGKIVAEASRIKRMGVILGEIDSLISLADVAERYGYVRPIVDNSEELDIEDGRHPVLETGMSSQERFVPNDTKMDSSDKQIMIITGPNMAGKSTYLRQVALIALMAQMGGFVPAKSAKIGALDRIFTRVGAQDFLYKGQSTFMVEMSETANILNNATCRSLIILDEIGRGTSTFDGISIAWSVVEYLHNNTGAKTLFATHYHELTELSLSLKRVINCNVAVKEWNDELIFLRKIVEGGADKSYGIQVGRIAGLPDEVIKRSMEILANLENKEFDEAGAPKIAAKKRNVKTVVQPLLPLFNQEENMIKNELQRIDPNNMTPMQALAKLIELKKQC